MPRQKTVPRRVPPRDGLANVNAPGVQREAVASTSQGPQLSTHQEEVTGKHDIEFELNHLYVIEPVSGEYSMAQLEQIDGEKDAYLFKSLCYDLNDCFSFPSVEEKEWYARSQVRRHVIADPHYKIRGDILAEFKLDRGSATPATTQPAQESKSSTETAKHLTESSEIASSSQSILRKVLTAPIIPRPATSATTLTKSDSNVSTAPVQLRSESSSMPSFSRYPLPVVSSRPTSFNLMQLPSSSRYSLPVVPNRPTPLSRSPIPSSSRHPPVVGWNPPTAFDANYLTEAQITYILNEYYVIETVPGTYLVVQLQEIDAEREMYLFRLSQQDQDPSKEGVFHFPSANYDQAWYEGRKVKYRVTDPLQQGNSVRGSFIKLDSALMLKFRLN